MPTLNWIGKEAVVKHHKDVPFRLLEPVTELSCGDSTSGNLIVQGDNLHALKALLPRYAGQVKCIYIDPPYNTGNEAWVYNDNVNSLEIKNRHAACITGLERAAMNKQPIEQALDADLRCASAALKRAALRARELAMKTGTAIVINRDGKLEYLIPDAPPAETFHVQETDGDYGDKA